MQDDVDVLAVIGERQEDRIERFISAGERIGIAIGVDRRTFLRRGAHHGEHRMGHGGAEFRKRLAHRLAGRFGEEIFGDQGADQAVAEILRAGQHIGHDHPSQMFAQFGRTDVGAGGHLAAAALRFPIVAQEGECGVFQLSRIQLRAHMRHTVGHFGRAPGTLAMC